MGRRKRHTPAAGMPVATVDESAVVRLGLQARLPNGAVVDLRECDLRPSRRSDRSALESPVFRLDEVLAVYQHREPMLLCGLPTEL